MSQKFPKHLQYQTKVIGIDVNCFIMAIIASYLTSLLVDTNKVVLFVLYLIFNISFKQFVEKGLLYKIVLQESEIEIDE